MKFSILADVFEKLENTSSGNEMRKILSEFFKKVPKDEIEEISYLLLGSIASKYDEINLGIADKMVLKSISIDSGKDLAEVSKLFKKTGDAGIAAEQLTGKAKSELTTKEVFQSLHRIAEASGSGSQDIKIKILADLLGKASPKEARYIPRIVLGTLRLGAGEMTILDALSIAFTGTKKNKEKLEHAYNICPDVGLIAKTIAEKGLKGIDNIGVKVGRPIQMMLCQRVPVISEIENKMSWPVSVEEKYDGERVQAHFTKGNLVLYSRRLENITEQFPDVAEAIREQIKAKEFVIEGEIVAVDKKGNLLPFQLLMRRRRKHDVEKFRKEIPVCMFAFDLLYLNGKSLIKESYPARHNSLEKIMKGQTNSLRMVVRSVCNNVECIEKFFNDSLSRGGEGVVIKSMQKDSVYQAGTRGWLWIKWKPEYSAKLADTFDLAVVGAFAGRGKRAGAYGALLCAVYNEKTDEFETFCKLGSGFTDEMLEQIPRKLGKYKIPHKPARLKVHKDMKPDVWFEPKIVVEVLGAEITRSPLHTSAEEQGKGLALRFPRFKRFRDDKKAEQATTSKEILQMFRKK
jgi:DNA ligase-1